MARYSIPPFAMLAIASFGVSALAQAPTSTRDFIVSGSLHDARVVHTATLLNDGRVLVAGGGQGLYTTEGYDNVPGAELFDPVSGSFTAAGTFARQYHSGTLLPSGKVLLAGGEKVFNTATTESELYDPITGQFQATGSLVVARESQTATLLQDGRVLMVGGIRSQDGGFHWVSLADAEIYDPVTGTFSLTGSLNDARSQHAATLLPSGKVLITGGFSFQSPNVLPSAELYDPATGLFTRTGSMSVQRSVPVATLLLDGHVLITGDGQNPELYDPATGSFALTGNTLVPREWHTATLLGDGTVLLVGGSNAAGGADIQAEIYDSVKRIFTAGPSLHFPRFFHTATSLADGSVAIIGGAASTNGILKFINSAEIYDVSWQHAIAAIEAAAGSDSQNFWQWAWYWQYLPAIQRAPVGFGTVGSISPGLMAQIIGAGGGDGFRTVSAEQWVLIYRQLIQPPASWQQAITEMKATARTNSLSFWQWAWCWQYSPAFQGAPSGFGVVGSINGEFMQQIILAGGGDGYRLVSAEDWLQYYRRAICAGCGNN